MSAMRYKNFRRIFSFVPVIFVAWLAGCAYAPVYNGAAIETDLENLPQYWIADKKTVSFQATPEEVAVLRTTSGRTSGTFLIDSNGNVTEVHISESEPPGVFDTATIKNYSGRSYAPGAENAERRPAKVRFENKFRMAPIET